LGSGEVSLLHLRLWSFGESAEEVLEGVEEFEVVVVLDLSLDAVLLLSKPDQFFAPGAIASTWPPITEILFAGVEVPAVAVQTWWVLLVIPA
jgi:hypothetical protein